MSGGYLMKEVTVLTEWLVKNGGYIHPDLRLIPVSSGCNAIAAQDIPADEQIVSCPFTLAITTEVSRQAICAILGIEDATSLFPEWTERQLLCTYLCLHKISDPDKTSDVLLHRPYVAMLPSPDQLRTPLHFTQAELDLFKGTNLYGATFDRRRDWEAEWKKCKESLSTHNSLLGEKFTWQGYLTAATYLSSRAFPSTLLSETPTLIPSSTSYPVLLPGVDSLNHARAQPVSWVVSHPEHPSQSQSTSHSCCEPIISLVLHTPTPRGHELFNNYGPKPNAELILGYGFALPRNPDDTIVLKIGGTQSTEQKWEVGRNASGIEPVWEAVKDAVCSQNKLERQEKDAEEGSVQDELWATEVLVSMAEDLLSRLPQVPAATARLGDETRTGIRSEVLEMLEYYIEGQQDILNSIIGFANEQENRIIQLAREQGVEIVDDD